MYTLTDLMILMIGGNRYVNYRKPITIEGTLADNELDNSISPAPAHHITITWGCFELAKNDICRD
jgi:hypothetical protein